MDLKAEIQKRMAAQAPFGVWTLTDFLDLGSQDRRDALGTGRRLGTPEQNIEKDFRVSWTFDAGSPPQIHSALPAGERDADRAIGGREGSAGTAARRSPSGGCVAASVRQRQARSGPSMVVVDALDEAAAGFYAARVCAPTRLSSTGAANAHGRPWHCRSLPRARNCRPQRRGPCRTPPRSSGITLTVASPTLPRLWC